MRPSRLTLLVFAAGTAYAQFGGRPGDAVVYLVSSKGDQTFDTVASTYKNPVAAVSRFESFPALTRPNEPPPGFPQLKILFLHRDPDDVFQVIVQDDVVPVPHHLYLTTFKIFVIKGQRRDYGYDTEQPRDFTTGGYTTFLKNADLGPNQAMAGELLVLGWSPTDVRPPLITTAPNVPGPAVPPGKTGTDLVVDFAVLPALKEWSPLRLKYPGVAWPDGVDLKFLETDPVHGNTSQLLRLRPGRKTPAYRMRGNTHFYVADGNLTLTPVGGTPIQLKPNDYAYIPDGFAFTLTNARTGLTVAP